MTNHDEPPQAILQDVNREQTLEYAGFWIRVVASLIDSILIVLVTLPLLLWIYGVEYFDPEQTGFMAGTAYFLISWVLPAIAVIVFWIYKSATPGKMLVSARIVDARTGERASTGQLIGRYFGYFVSGIPFLLGLIWVAFDRRKQGWHDKLAGTVVVREKNRGPEPVRFDRQV
ncbi:RDD family protein [Thiobaca trueperi]|uniref:Putative RDD family membrane protein YckC n=1 Tax=Thiobaca trueperi TaxID=127458 RepID=A0A4R3MU52_9GAMM|nr:RDD family protein [Thiobaca trueperi]TCT19864.1 putative RDD family membrane protein YckC [Thiobaca trueperi]